MLQYTFISKQMEGQIVSSPMPATGKIYASQLIVNRPHLSPRWLADCLKLGSSRFK